MIVPFAELPPATLLTDQVTDELVVPVTVAANCWELPARTLAGFGATETLTEPVAGGLGGAVGGVGDVCVAEIWAQPACNAARMARSRKNLRCKEKPP